jgi:hypothetical protein
MFWYFWNGGDVWLSSVALAWATVRDIINGSHKFKYPQRLNTIDQTKIINVRESVVIVKVSYYGSNRLHTPQKDCFKQKLFIAHSG